MKYIFTLLLGVAFFTSCDKINLDNPTEILTDEEVVSGLKEALRVGTDSSVTLTSKADGYFKNNAIKIIMPAEAKKVENTLRDLGMGKLVDDAILSINRAAEDAAVEAKPIFWNAITSMTVTDGKNILFGDSVAATNYLKDKTYADLSTLFQPKIKASLDKVNATKYWSDLFNAYNRLPLVDPVNPDLEKYATQKALDGLFYMVSKEEQSIRKNPLDRVNDILKKVFGELDK